MYTEKVLRLKYLFYVFKKNTQDGWKQLKRYLLMEKINLIFQKYVLKDKLFEIGKII